MKRQEKVAASVIRSVFEVRAKREKDMMAALEKNGKPDCGTERGFALEQPQEEWMDI